LVGATQTKEQPARANKMSVSDTGTGVEKALVSVWDARDLIIAPIEKRPWTELINRMGASFIFTQRVSFSPNSLPEPSEDKNGSELRLPLYRAGFEFDPEDLDFLLLRAEPNRQLSINCQNWSTIKANVIFHLRYAQSRCFAILRQALEPSVNVETQQIEPPLISESSWCRMKEEFHQNLSVFMYGLSDSPLVYADQKALILHLAAFPTEILLATDRLAPARLVPYASDLADKLDSFLRSSQIITADKTATQARLGMIFAIKQVLENVLGIMGVTAPERM